MEGVHALTDVVLFGSTAPLSRKQEHRQSVTATQREKQLRERGKEGAVKAVAVRGGGQTDDSKKRVGLFQYILSRVHPMGEHLHCKKG